MKLFFGTWSDLGRTLVVAPITYVMLVLLLRVSGKRTLAKLSAFDLVVTIAFGSTLASAFVSRTVSLAEAGLAFVLLIGLQFAVTRLTMASGRMRRTVKAEPTVLLYRGLVVEQAMQDERITQDELRQAVRKQGVASLETVGAVVLETDGSFSVLESVVDGEGSSLAGVTIPATAGRAAPAADVRPHDRRSEP